jgi:hypothetical protein
MAGALAKQEEFAFETPVASKRAEVLSRYRLFREISKQHNHEAMKLLPPNAVLQHARRLGLAFGRTVVLDHEDDLTYAFDLAIYTGPPGRSRAIDRYARAAKFSARSDEALVLKAMCNARFKVLCVERRHQAAGLIVKDLACGNELWVVDEGRERSLAKGALIATRLYTPESFSMTAGVMVLLDVDLLKDTLDELPQIGRKQPEDVIDDRRFAETLYRLAIEGGLTENIVYRDLAEAKLRPG